MPINDALSIKISVKVFLNDMGASPVSMYNITQGYNIDKFSLLQNQKTNELMFCLLSL